MARLILFVFTVVLAISATAQRVNLDQISVRDKVILRGKQIDSISIDKTFTSPVNTEIPSQKAVFDFVADQIAAINLSNYARATSTNGLFVPGNLPFGAGDGKLGENNNLNFTSNVMNAPAFSVNGTSGSGFFALSAQGSSPAAPGSGIRIFANSANNLGFIRNDGYITTISLAGATGNRFFNLPVDAGTFGILENSQTWTGANTFSTNITLGGNIVFNSFNRTIASSSVPVSDIWVSSVQSLTSFHSGGGATGLTFNNNSQALFRAWDNGNFLIQTGGTYTDVTSSIFTVNSTAKFAINAPKMSTAQRDAIIGSVSGAKIFNTTTLVDNFHTGSIWAEYHVSSNAIVNTNNNHRLGFLQILSSGSAGTTGQGIVVTGFDQTVQFQGTVSGAPPNTFTFDTYGAVPRGMTNSNPLNAFIRINSGFQNPNTVNISAAVLAVTPVYNINAHSGATIRGIYYNPTLTSMVGVGAHNAWESTSGNIIISSGNVGIGAASPTRPLMISNANEDVFHITNTTSGITARMGVGSGSFASSGWFTIQVNGSTIFTSDATNRFSISAARLNGTSSQTLTISGGFGAATLGTGIILSSNAIDAGVFTATSGTQTNVRIGGNNNTWQPASGNATFQSLLINPIFNTTGTYSGTARGIYYNPTITSVTGLTHNAWESTSGNMVVENGGISVNTDGSMKPFSFSISGSERFRMSTNGVVQFGSAGVSTFDNNTSFTFFGANLVTAWIWSTNNGLNVSANNTASYISHSGNSITTQNNGIANLQNINPNLTISSNTSALSLIRGYYYNPNLTIVSGGLGRHFAWESTAGDFLVNGGSMGIGVSSLNPSVLLELNSTVKGFLLPRGTDAQISAVASPALLLMMGSTTSERINVKRTSGFFQLAYTQDILRDSTYKTVNSNLDLSGLTTTFKTRFHTVRIKTVVTAAATGNNTITMPVPSADLLGISFKISVEDTSGDGDISVLSFGTDGTDGYLYNGDGSFGTSMNLFPGIGVYLSVAWCEAKSAYRWELQ